jgi:lipopolysaccharide transport system ATP-binding protein
VAAHLEPEILLVDEVLAVGDAQFQKKCLGKMSEVASGGRTVLFVSHQMNVIARLCDRVALLEAGFLTGVDSPEPMIARYLEADAESASGKVDLRNRIRPEKCTGRVRLVSAEVLPGPRVKFGHPLEVSMTFEVIQRVDCVEPGLIVRTIDGQNLSAMVSGDFDGPVLRLPQVGSTYEAKVVVPECRWVPRVYKLVLGARSGPSGTEDQVDIGTVEILGDEHHPSCFEIRWDSYRPPVQWTINLEEIH